MRESLHTAVRGALAVALGVTALAAAGAPWPKTPDFNHLEMEGVWYMPDLQIPLTFEILDSGETKVTMVIGFQDVTVTNADWEFGGYGGYFWLTDGWVGLMAQLDPSDRDIMVVESFDYDESGAEVPGSRGRAMAYRRTAPKGWGPPPEDGITGEWRTVVRISQGDSYFVDATFEPDGTARYVFVSDGEVMTHYSGTYTLAEDGLLEFVEAARSPLLCVGGECEPTILPETNGTRQVKFWGASSFYVFDPALGYEARYDRLIASGP